MGTIKTFEESRVWIEAKMLALIVYKDFTSCKDFSFRDQIRRASISVSNNIAEGFERGTNPELSRFLYIAKGSVAETRSMLHIAKDLGYIDDTSYKELISKTLIIAKMLSAFIKTIQPYKL